jgi:cyclic nucleotide gated channel beta 1
MLRKASMMTAATVISLVIAGATPLQAEAGRPNRRQWRDRVEDVRDRREDRRDWREDIRDRRRVGGWRDRRENRRDWRR